MEESILDQLELGELSEASRRQMLNQITDIVAIKIIEACASEFSELEMSRMEYLIEQRDVKLLQKEVQSHIHDPEAMLTKVANDTIAELRDTIKQIVKKEPTAPIT